MRTRRICVGAAAPAAVVFPFVAIVAVDQFEVVPLITAAVDDGTDDEDDVGGITRDDDQAVPE